MADCSLTNAELAKRVGVFPSTVSAWTNGKTKKVPGSVIAYLELLATIKRLAA
jgi:transcriptional regulator with XRE-family HTH domain